MFNWDDGNIWVNSLPDRPALDVVTGALFVIGIVLLIVRYVRQRDWRDLLPVGFHSHFAYAVCSFAGVSRREPCVESRRRGGGGGYPCQRAGARWFGGKLGRARSKKRVFIAYGLTGLLFAVSAFQNYDLVFNKFDANFKLGAWNTSEMGGLISEFRDEYGQTDSVWIVPFPHWVDTRLPACGRAFPNRDFALWPDEFCRDVKCAWSKDDHVSC